jgi:hypothetical protein
MTANLKIVRVRADFRAAREVNKFQMRLSLVQCWKFLSAGQFSEQSLLQAV